MKISDKQIQDLIGKAALSISDDKVSKLVSGKTVFITGGAGSIGSEIVRQILKYKPSKLVVLDQAETPLNDLILEIQDSSFLLDFHPVICDITNNQKLRYLFEEFKPNLVYHCAAYKHVPLMEQNPTEAVLVNVFGTKILADLALEFEVEKFIFVSTDKAVKPASIMGASKRLAELYLQSLPSLYSKSFNTKFITTRFGNVLGSNGSVLSIFNKQIEKGGPLTITHPDVTRYLLSIPDASKLILEVSLMETISDIYIFDMGKPVKILDLANKMIALAGYIPEKDIAIKVIGLRSGEKLFEELLHNNAETFSTHHEKIFLVKEQEVDSAMVNSLINKIISDLKDYKPTNIVNTIKALISDCNKV